MVEKYDGWVLKVGQYLRAFTFHEKKTDVVKDFERFCGGEGSWREHRRKGTHKIVKVKLVEVE